MVKPADPATRIPCPACRALTGQPCRPPLWPSDVGGTHRERVEAWRNVSRIRTRKGLDRQGRGVI